MPRTSRFHVLLISRVPEEHREVVRSFRRSGADVLVAARPARALSLLHLRPELVLVDLAHGCALSPALVRELNRQNDARLVVALHDGCLETAAADATELSVHGYCRAGDLAAGNLAATGAAFPASLTVH